MPSFYPLALLLLSAPAQAAAAPAPACTVLQPQVKQCSVSAIGGVGTFDVVVAPPAGLVVAFDDAVVGMEPPPASSYRASFSGTTATVAPIRRDPIAGATVHFDTATVHVTLNLKLGPKADTQVLIVDPRKGARDEEVERRVKAATEGLEDRASARADEMLVSDLASGIDVADTDVSPSRHNQVVLRTRKLVRLGERRVLLFSVENRGGDQLTVKAVRLWLAGRELPRPGFSVSATTIPVNQEVPAAVVVPKGVAGDVVRLRVEFTDADRTVEIDGIKLRWP